MEENGGRTQWYVIGMALSIVVVTLLVLMAIIFTFVLTVDSGGAVVEGDVPALIEEDEPVAEEIIVDDEANEDPADTDETEDSDDTE